jgi:hypothetical protein
LTLISVDGIVLADCIPSDTSQIGVVVGPPVKIRSEERPSMSRPVKKVMLISTENIKTYTVNFYNVDGSVIKKTVSIYGIDNVKVE